MAKGTVKWLNDSKGFGLITKEDGDDIFVHHRSISGSGFRSLSLTIIDKGDRLPGLFRPCLTPCRRPSRCRG